MLTFPRFNLYEKDYDKTIQTYEKAYFNFLKRILNENVKVCGVDLVGTNEKINWDYYAQLIRKMREEINDSIKNKSCFITYHLDEQKSVAPLKEICEILTLLKIGCLKKGDRISHGWSLLSKTDISNQKDVEEMSLTEWNLIKARLEDSEAKLTDEQKETFKQLRLNTKEKQEKAFVNAKLMSKLADSLQPLVKSILIDEDILLEVCPTSSWRIAGIPLPTGL